MRWQEKAFAIVCLFFLLFSFVPTGYELYRRGDLRPERSFELVHNFPTDYNFYLSRIREGIEGRWTVIEKYTGEPHEGSFIQILYLFLGRLGRWVRVPWERGGDVYHIARIAFGMTMLFIIAEFSKKAFEKKFPLQLLAFILAITASTWPKIVAVIDNKVVSATVGNISSWRFGGYMPWWSVMDSLQRITFIPHILVGQALVVFLIMAHADGRASGKRRNWIFLGILGFVLGIVFPPGLLFVYTTLLVLAIFDKRFMSRVIFLSVSLPSLVYLQLMTSFYPWKRLVEVDIIRPLPFEWGEYFLAVGPVLPLGIFGLIVAVKSRAQSMSSSVAWVIAWITLLVVFSFIPQQSPLRFSEVLPHVPLAILTVYLFTKMGKKFFVVPIVLTIVGFGIMYSSWLWQRDFIDHKIRATVPLVPTGSYVMYPLKDFLLAMKFIQDNTSRNTVILSETTAGNYMAVYSGNSVYVGHDNTVRLEDKQVKVKQFFSGQLPRDTAYEWLKQERLSVIFFGPQEREDGGLSKLESIYPFLQSVYTNTYVTIYRVSR